ncbi:methyl-accepting chemotaxis protein [Pseudohongiella nitratireducens]|uniref:methyl-accepting chemotaxis protein n=1 Tax=Pseudohongiella nitratireducens TaxID=1768907 RepID=UPI0030EBFE02
MSTALYNRWSEVSSRVITLMENGQIELAARLSQTDSSQAFDELRNLIDVIQGEQIAQSDFYTAQAMSRSTDAVVRLVMATIVGMIISVLMVVFVPPLITKPLLIIRKNVEGIASGNGDLTARIAVSSKDEVGDLGEKFNLFLDKLHTMVSQIKNCALQVSDSSTGLAEISSINRNALNTQNKALDTVVSAVHEMSKAIGEVAHNTTLTAEKAQNAQVLSSNGLDTVNKAVTQIQEVSAQVEGVSELVAGVEAQVINVTSVLDVIKGIAEQTNLLALNAAIEAARAGEQGRGFAVVADEVRTLANRTQESTTDIQAMLEKLQSGVSNTVVAMRTSAGAALDSVNTANEGGKALSEINDSVVSIADMTVHVAAAVEEQSVVIEEINQNLASISEQSVTTSDSATKTDQSSQDLGVASSELMANVGNFKL